MFQNLINSTYPFAKWALFKLDAEVAHNLTIQGLKVWQSALSSLSQSFPSPPSRGQAFGRESIRFNLDPRIREEDRIRDDKLGLQFAHPVGLAAGLDKNAECLLAWQALGFSYVEVGTVTAQPQPGNPKPRLFRIPQEQALYNRMGFNNDGADIISKRIRKVRDGGRLHIPIGVNIGKTKVIELNDAPADYVSSFRAIQREADYVVINVSSPNTPGLRELQGRDHLMRILDGVQNENQKSRQLPILLKIAPDMTLDAASESAKVAIEMGLKGMVLTNTRAQNRSSSRMRGSKLNRMDSRLRGKDRDLDDRRISGGLSGAPIFDMSTQMLSHIHQHFGDDLTLIGVGGIMDAASAKAKLDAGADLIQLYSGFIYRGPGLIDEILQAGGA